MLGSRERQLGISFKKLFQHDSGVELKVKGLLNTVSCNAELQGALNKVRRRRTRRSRQRCMPRPPFLWRAAVAGRFAVFAVLNSPHSTSMWVRESRSRPLPCPLPRVASLDAPPLPHVASLDARHPLQFFRVGKLAVYKPNEVYQPDLRLRLGLGVKAAGVGGQKMSAGGLPTSRPVALPAARAAAAYSC